ncbi:uncharacterized protein LOC131228937 [Magnolia sinica]|uniref:uncharacterized protein LOC131228937 n=1 Tax=Magnolia sinica TaxID=86752 RepID=UPI00265ACFEF|nr:uncharacterized protein LOC131228937 [Magnolia sinica]
MTGNREPNHEKLGQLILQLYLSQCSNVIPPNLSFQLPPPPLPSFSTSSYATAVALQEPPIYIPPFAVDYGQTTSIPVSNHHPTTIFKATVVQQQDPPPNVVAQQNLSPVRRHRPTNAPHGNKDEHVVPPFEWATDHRATVHSLDYLRSHDITRIKGDVECERCESRYQIEFDLNISFGEISEDIIKKKISFSTAPNEWMNPKLLDCIVCQQTECLKPVISEKKRSINWLFLLFGKMLGCCSLEQLKYFCKHTRNHRTGAKDRLLYLTYLALCKQLDPHGPVGRFY